MAMLHVGGGVSCIASSLPSVLEPKHGTGAVASDKARTGVRWERHLAEPLTLRSPEAADADILHPGCLSCLALVSAVTPTGHRNRG